jgi:hypothetical protein
MKIKNAHSKIIEMMKIKETYAQARARLHVALGKIDGWKISSPSLKVLWADSPSGYRLWFRAQAVYKNEHSLFVDIREMTVEELIENFNY